MDDVALFKAVANYGIGVVCLVAVIAHSVYVTRVTLPALTETYRTEMAVERQQHREDRAAFLAVIEAGQKAVSEAHAALLRLGERKGG